MNDQTHITLIYLCTQIPENYKLPFRMSFLQPYRLCYDMASHIGHRICVKHHLKPCKPLCDLSQRNIEIKISYNDFCV